MIANELLIFHSFHINVYLCTVHFRIARQQAAKMETKISSTLTNLGIVLFHILQKPWWFVSRKLGKSCKKLLPESGSSTLSRRSVLLHGNGVCLLCMLFTTVKERWGHNGLTWQIMSLINKSQDWLLKTARTFRHKCKLSPCAFNWVFCIEMNSNLSN